MPPDAEPHDVGAERSGPSAGAAETIPRPREADGFRRERLADLAILLPLLGAFALLSPLVRAFAQPLEVAGAPLIVVYIFGVWAALILVAALLARSIPTTARKPEPPPPPQRSTEAP